MDASDLDRLLEDADVHRGFARYALEQGWTILARRFVAAALADLRQAERVAELRHAGALRARRGAVYEVQESLAVALAARGDGRM